jgi:retinoid X receptor beta
MSASGGRIIKRGRGRGLAPIHIPCSICGDLAPDHMHYGGVACFSCRAFFRRSVDKAHTYHCPENKKCPIDETTRRNCQFCRYQKCLESGMKPTWVLTEQEKQKRIVKKRENAVKREQEMTTKLKNAGNFC